MRVDVRDRRDDETLVCRVAWTGQNLAKLRVTVLVLATLDEFSSGDLPQHLRTAAIQEARNQARAFADVEDY